MGARVATSAADADVLLVCGTPGPELAGVIDRLWDQLPGPRARAVVHFPTDVDAAVARAILDLQDVGAQRVDAQQRGVHPDRRSSPRGCRTTAAWTTTRWTTATWTTTRWTTAAWTTTQWTTAAWTTAGWTTAA